MSTLDAPEPRVWRALSEELQAGRPAVLVVVAKTRGSSPGRPGWVLAVGADGPLAGTVGGGPAEEQAIEAAQELRGAERGRLLRQVHRAGVGEASGLLCGGEQHLALTPLTRRDADGVAAVAAALERGERIGWHVDDDGWRLAPSCSPGFVADPAGWSFEWSSGPSHVVYLIGAGHVGRALSGLLVTLGFRVHVIDERPGAAATLRGCVHGLGKTRYEELASVVPAGERTLVVIATHAPDRDAAALTALAGRRLGYLGLLGSRRKVAALLGDGQPPLWLRAPMGVSIGSRTPAEIAISVAAELVALRALTAG